MRFLIVALPATTWGETILNAADERELLEVVTRTIASRREAAAARAAAAKIARDKDLVYWAKEIVLRAERQAGAMLAAIVPHQGGRPKKGNANNLSAFSVSQAESHRWQRVAAVAAKIATMKQGARTDIARIQAMSQPEAGKLLNVSRNSVQQARKVLERAVFSPHRPAPLASPRGAGSPCRPGRSPRTNRVSARAVRRPIARHGNMQRIERN